MKKSKFLFRYFLICFFFLTTTPNSFAQIVTKKDTLAKYTFIQLENKFYAAKPDSLKAVNYAKYYIKKAIKEKDTLQTAEGYYYLSDITKDSIYFVNYWNGIIKKTRELNNKLYPAVSYLELGDFYFHQGILDRALKNYLLIQKTTNDSLIYISIHRLGLIKGSNNKSLEAIILYKKVYNYYKKQKGNHTDKDYISLLGNLSISFFKINEYDSALFYNEKAFKIALNYKDKNVLGYNIYTRGKLNYHKKKYNLAISDFKKSIPLIINDENFKVVSAVYNNIAKSYIKQNKIIKGVKYYKKIDSLKSAIGFLSRSQKKAYKFLANYYKKENNDAKQLEYINKYIKVDSVLNARSKSINKSLTDNYDIPNLLAEKKRIEDRLKGDLSATKKWVFGVGTLSFLLAFFLIHQTRKRKTYKQRFEELMNASRQTAIPKNETIAKKENSIPKETVENILTLLHQFENNHEYISSDVTLSSLAKTFETNSKYLSQLINQYKGKSFTNYINELRINYTVEKFKKDSIFSKYSIKAIALEVGFSTTESFSKAFLKNTGIKPSFFIKELERK